MVCDRYWRQASQTIRDYWTMILFWVWAVCMVGVLAWCIMTPASKPEPVVYPKTGVISHAESDCLGNTGTTGKD